MTAPQLSAATRGWRLGARIPLTLRNPEPALAEATAIARLRPGQNVELFSLPAEIERALAERAAAQALKALGAIAQADEPLVEGHGRAVVVYLHRADAIRVVDHHYKYTRGKFGAGEGLGTSRKLRVTSESIRELAVLPV